MNDFLDLFLALGPIFFVGIFVVIAIVVQLVNINLRNSTLQDVASRAGLTYEEGGVLRSGTVTGTYMGRGVIIRAYQKRQGRSSYTHTRIDVGAPQAKLTRFQLSNANVLTRSGLMKSVPTGDSEFDRRYRLLVQPEDIATSVVGANYGLRNGLMGLGRYSIAFGVGALRFDQRGFKRDGGYHRQVLDVMVELAAALETYTQQSGSMPESYDGLPESSNDW